MSPATVLTLTVNDSRTAQGVGGAVKPATGITTDELLALGPTTDVVTAGRAYGLGRHVSYDLAKRGEFPCQVVRLGRQYRVITADLLKALGIEGGQ